MATKDDDLVPLKKQFILQNAGEKNKYSNFCLNQSQKCLNASFVQSNSKTISNNKGFGSKTVEDEKRSLHLWNKSTSNNLHPKSLKSFASIDEAEETIATKRWKNNSSNATTSNSSTLSLHIAAYENSVEGGDTVPLDKNEGMKKNLINGQKQMLIDSALNPFEFPRQQTDDKTDPAVMQFTASQQLLNPNQSNSSDNNQQETQHPSPSSAENLATELFHGQDNKMSSVLNVMAKNKEEDCYAYVGMDQSAPGEITIKVIGRESEECISNCIYESAKEFVRDIPKLFTPQYKTVLLYVCDSETPDFENNIEFCKAARAQLDALQIPHYFIGSNEFVTSHILIKSNITVQPQQTVLFLTVGIDFVSVVERRYTENGYETLNTDMVGIDRKENPAMIREKLLGSLNPQKILIMHKKDAWATSNFLRKHVLKSKKVIVTDTDMGSNVANYILEWSKWLLDKSYTKFYVIPTCSRIFAVMTPFGKCPLLTVDLSDTVPCAKSAFVSKINGKAVLTCATYNNMKPFTAGTVEWNQNCHTIKVTLSVDAESFPSLQYEPVIVEVIQDLPKRFDEKMEEKVPVIGFYTDCSFICVYDEQAKCYKFLDAWNGQYGKALAMSFDSEKPLFGDRVYGNLKIRPSSIVHDLIKVMVMPEDDIQINENWPFSITRDEQNPVLIEFESFNGSRKAATPTFLMAMILKEHIKAIKAETGINHNKFGIYCLYPGGDQDGRNRIEDQITEALKLLKVESVISMFTC